MYPEGLRQLRIARSCLMSHRGELEVSAVIARTESEGEVVCDVALNEAQPGPQSSI